MDRLAVGDTVVLRPGARVPVDATILSGEGSLDESTITGESAPVHKGPGAAVHEATVNLNGILDVRVSRPLAESTVARMIELVAADRDAAPPMWKVRIVSCVPGSPMDWAATMPTASPMSTSLPVAIERP